MTWARGSILGRLVLTAGALLLTGCMLSGGDTFYSSNTVGGGGEDFPNTVTRLGKIAAADVAASSDWESLQNLELPEIPAINIDSLRVDPPTFKRASLAKTAVSADCLPLYWTWDIQEFLRYRQIRKITCTEDVSTVRRDTLFYYYAGGPLPATREEFEAKPDSFVTLVSSRGSITWPGLNKVQYFRASNLDSLGGLDYGDFLTVQTEAGGQSFVVQRVKIYGPEGAYLNPTAAPEEFEYTRLSASGDTLEWKRMRDADGDRAFWDNTGTGIVSFERIVRSPDGEPGTARLSLFMKAQLVHDTVTGDDLKRLYYRDARVLLNGGTASFSFIGDAPDSVLRAHDTAIVTSDTVFATRDSMSTYHGVYRLLLGDAPEAMAGHALIGFGIDKTWRRGPLRHSTTAFTPPAPVIAGQGAFAGVMEFVGAYANGDTIRTVGTVGAEGMEMDYYGVKSGKEESYRLVFDINGNPVGEPVPIPGTDTTGTASPKRRVP